MMNIYVYAFALSSNTATLDPLEKYEWNAVRYTIERVEEKDSIEEYKSARSHTLTQFVLEEISGSRKNETESNGI